VHWQGRVRGDMRTDLSEHKTSQTASLRPGKRAMRGISTNTDVARKYGARSDSFFKREGKKKKKTRRSKAKRNWTRA